MIERDTLTALVRRFDEFCDPGEDAVYIYITKSERDELAAALAVSPRFDPSNHHNALLCPYCNPEGKALAVSPQLEICGVRGDPPLGPDRIHVCELVKGHDGYHRDGAVTWLGYHVEGSVSLQPPADDYCQGTVNGYVGCGLRHGHDGPCDYGPPARAAARLLEGSVSLQLHGEEQAVASPPASAPPSDALRATAKAEAVRALVAAITDEEWDEIHDSLDASPRLNEARHLAFWRKLNQVRVTSDTPDECFGAPASAPQGDTHDLSRASVPSGSGNDRISAKEPQPKGAEQ